ncbi:MAG TPA: formimidoylglutamase [Gemmatimonadales bacterium]|nr:formimidoylglutamase [Gemmatimonadales bacterium]
MTRIIPPDVTQPATAPNDPRLGRILGRSLAAGEEPDAVILGFPCDEGIRRNGGRVGAAGGPSAIRAALYQLAPDARSERFEHRLGRTRDLGDIEMSGVMESDQQHLGEVVAPYIRTGRFVVVLGGGHETSYGHFLGYVLAQRRVEILNWDAHPDVRDPAGDRGHSGSPFRQAVEHGSNACRRYSVAGLQPHLAAREHVAYVERHGRVIWRDDVTLERIAQLYRSADDPTMASFDLDTVNEAEAPGVSAPNSGGLTSDLWIEAAYQAGRSAGVASVDVVELNPVFDRDGQTARLAAVTVWWLLRGWSERR